MAATPDTVAILNPDEYVAANPDGKIPSAEPSTWEMIKRQGNANKEQHVQMGYERVNFNPEISQPTQQVLGEAMSRQLKAILKVDQDVLAMDSKYERYRSFLSHIKQKYAERNNGRDISEIEDNPDALDTFMTSLMKDDSNVLWATKIAETQLAVLEAASGVYTHVDSQLQPAEFVGKQAVLTEDNKDGGQDRLLGDQDLKPIWKGIRRFIPWAPATFDPANKVSREVNKGLKKILQWESKQKRQSVVYVDFEENAKLDMHVTIGGREIDDVQASMLRNLELAGLVRHGEYLTTGAKNEIADLAIGIQEARTNAYSYMGFNLSEYNMTQNNGNRVTPDFDYRVVPDAPRIVTDGFDLPHREVYVGVGRMRVDKQIDILQDAINEKAKELVEKNRPTTALKAIEGHITRLEGVDAQDLDRADEIETVELPKFQQLEQFFNNKNGKEKEVENLKAKQDSITTRFRDESDIDDWTVTPTTPGAPLPKITYEEAYNRWNSSESVLQAQQQVVNTLQNEITGITTLITNKKNDTAAIDTEIERLNNLIGQVNATGSTRRTGLTPYETAQIAAYSEKIMGTPTTPGLVAKRTTIEGEITTLEGMKVTKEGDRVREKTTLNTRQGEFDTVKTQVGENRYNKMKSWDQERTGYGGDIVNKKDEIRDLEIQAGRILVKDATTTPPTLWTDAEVKTKIKSLEEEKKAAGSKSPDVERQLVAYKQLQDRLKAENLKTIYDRSYQYSQNPEVSNQIIEAKIAYPEYPRSYLYALQVLYGSDITLPQNSSKFKDATTWFTPELFVQHLPRSGGARYEVTDAILDAPVATEMINYKYMRRMMSYVMDEAHRGKLGQYSDAEKAALTLIEQESADDFDAEVQKRDDLVHDTQESYRHVIPDFEATTILSTIGVPATDRLRYFTFFKNIYNAIPPITPALPLDASRKQVLEEFKNSFATVGEPMAEKIVDSMYGLYNKAKTAEKVYVDSMKGRSGNAAEVNAYLLSSAAQLIVDYKQQKEFMTMVESGKSFNQIARELSARTPPPEYYTYIDSIIFQLRYGTDPRRAIAATYSTQMRNTVGVVGLSDIRIQQQLQRQSKLVDTVRSREIFKGQLDSIKNIYPSLSVDDMTLRVIKVLGKSYNDPDDVRECKMLASQLYNERKAIQRA